MKRDARRRMVVTTAKLLQRQGYNGTGLNQIVAEAEAPKGSLYFHFPGGKEQLAAEAIAASAAYLDAGLRACERASALASLDLYVEEAAKLLERTDYAEGCPIATVILEVGTSSALIGKACADAVDLQISASRAGSSATGSAQTRLAGVRSSSTRASRVRCCWPRRGRAWSRWPPCAGSSRCWLGELNPGKATERCPHVAGTTTTARNHTAVVHLHRGTHGG